MSSSYDPRRDADGAPSLRSHLVRLTTTPEGAR
jgi:hypothetical protein